MNITEKCCVCEKSLKYGDVVNLMPCMDKIHKRCHEYLSSERSDQEILMTCPFCGEEILTHADFVRRKYKRHALCDRKRVLEAAGAERDWQHTADILGVHRNTAESWIKIGTMEPQKKGGNREKIISPEQIERLVDWLEEDPQMTIKDLKEKACTSLGLDVSVSTISRCLHGQCLTLKKVHHEPINMNNPVNKQKRKAYVQQLQGYMESGGYIFCCCFNLISTM